MSVHEDTLQGLQEALDYVRGDKSKGRTMLHTGSTPEGNENEVLFQKIIKLPEISKQKAIKYVDELLEASAE